MEMIILSLKTQRQHEWIVGDNCNYIEEHPARGDGDKWFYDVFATNDDGEQRTYRIFDPLEVEFNREETL